MIITKDLLNEKVPIEMIPKRFDSATDIFIYTKKGLLLYNMTPTTWNVLYPFYQTSNKFTVDSIDINNKDITYKELVDIYKNIYESDYVLKRGFDESKRKQVLIDEFNEKFGVSGTRIKRKIDSHYELKYSKSKNVYTLYYLESYIADYIDDINKLLKQKVYAQELLSLETFPVPKEVNGTPLGDMALLDDKETFDLIKENIID